VSDTEGTENLLWFSDVVGKSSPAENAEIL
jgi:hypothetical protein